jgi:activating signal cointegrator 1
MKAISLWQPYASAMAVGAKRFETRHWAAPRSIIGRRIAVHAAKATRPRDRDGKVVDLRGVLADILDDCHESRAIFETYLDLSFDHLPFGAIIATGILKTCHRVEGLPLSAIERRWGDYSPGRFAWEFTDVTKLSTPIPFTGRQGVFEVGEVAS